MPSHTRIGASSAGGLDLAVPWMTSVPIPSQWLVEGDHRIHADIRQVSMSSPSSPRLQITIRLQGDGTIFL